MTSIKSTEKRPTAAKSSAVRDRSSHGATLEPFPAEYCDRLGTGVVPRELRLLALMSRSLVGSLLSWISSSILHLGYEKKQCGSGNVRITDASIQENDPCA